MLYFATEHASSFSLLDFNNNLVNWVILVVVLVYLWNKLMPAVFAERKNKIEIAIEEATLARKEGQEFLQTQQKRIANAEAEAKSILVEAKKVAEQMKVQLTEQTKTEVKELEAKITQQIANERQLAVTELRSQAAIAAVHLAEAALPGAITTSAKNKLLDQFIEQLETVRN
jgi:F-type H+-transporting ATPase subunit b